MALLPTDANLTAPAIDMETAVAIGAIKGWTSLRKFAANPSIESGTEDMWGEGGTLVWPSAAATASIVSTSPEDDPAGAGTSTGAHEVTVQGLDADYQEVTEVVPMTGTTPAVTTTEFYRLNRMFVGDCGTADSNVGIIRASIGGNVQASILAGLGQSQVSHYTVPDGKNFVVDYYSVGIGRMAGSTDANIRGQIRIYDANAATGDHQGWRTITNIFLYNGELHTNDRTVTVLPPKTDLRVQVISTVATQGFSIVGGFLVETATQGNY